MKHILIATFVAVWMLAGCNTNTNTNTKNTGPCNNYDNETLCSTASYNNTGCYWAKPAAGAQGPTACVAVADCGQATTKSACEASSQANTKCTWDGSSCYLNLKADNTSKCSMFADQTSCQSSSTFEGVCYWTGTACAAATACSNIQDKATCSGSTVAKKACQWTPGPNTCRPNSPAKCSQSIKSGVIVAVCCAGNDTTCEASDPSCIDYRVTTKLANNCFAEDSFTCTLNKNQNGCCSGKTGVENRDCTSTNPNCTFDPTKGSCGDA